MLHDNPFLVPSIWWLFCCCQCFWKTSVEQRFRHFLSSFSSLLSSVPSEMAIWEELTTNFGLLQGFPDKNSSVDFVEELRRLPRSSFSHLPAFIFVGRHDTRPPNYVLLFYSRLRPCPRSPLLLEIR